tara:strand:- start:6 stop:335 length:330 start_codon:yes stop_codon:yes gene_type:complete
MPFSQVELNRRFREKNPERAKEIQEKYRKTDTYKMSYTITGWKQSGLIETDQYTYKELYEAYLHQGYCENCEIKLTSGSKDSTFKCMDHDHTTGIFRDILCNSCNVKRG